MLPWTVVSLIATTMLARELWSWGPVVPPRVMPANLGISPPLLSLLCRWSAATRCSQDSMTVWCARIDWTLVSCSR